VTAAAGGALPLSVTSVAAVIEAVVVAAVAPRWRRANAETAARSSPATSEAEGEGGAAVPAAASARVTARPVPRGKGCSCGCVARPCSACPRSGRLGGPIAWRRREGSGAGVPRRPVAAAATRRSVGRSMEGRAGATVHFRAPRARMAPRSTASCRARDGDARGEQRAAARRTLVCAWLAANKPGSAGPPQQPQRQNAAPARAVTAFAAATAPGVARARAAHSNRSIRPRRPCCLGDRVASWRAEPPPPPPPLPPVPALLPARPRSIAPVAAHERR
jgi:hypothetical protein